MNRPVLALDLGGTQVRAAVILPDGSRVARHATSTPSEQGAEAVIQACIATLAAARTDAPGGIDADLAGIGVSSPGPVNPWTGVIVSPPNLGAQFHDIAMAARLEEALGLPVYLERDTNVAALGEQAFGAAHDVQDFLYVTVSTGVGGAIMADGHLVLGPDGTAGELGHVSIELDGPTCGCGGRGHLEAISSGVALARDAREAVARGTSPFLAARAAASPDGPAGLDARDVAEGEDARDRVCVRLMDHARRAFAMACAGFVNTFNPELIVIGGSIAEHQGDRLLDPARAEIKRGSFATPAARVRLVP
ncbi:MAG: ROK family protein, partial [Candidatus Limnocylindrales bacterium]